MLVDKYNWQGDRILVKPLKEELSALLSSFATNDNQTLSRSNTLMRGEIMGLGPDAIEKGYNIGDIVYFDAMRTPGSFYVGPIDDLNKENAQDKMWAITKPEFIGVKVEKIEVDSEQPVYLN